jgi:hypothetical protein
LPDIVHSYPFALLADALGVAPKGPSASASPATDVDPKGSDQRDER